MLGDKLNNLILRNNQRSVETPVVKLKGCYDGLCNRSACLSPNNVHYFNYGTEKYYCVVCANLINTVNKKEALEIHGHNLCLYVSEDGSITV